LHTTNITLIHKGNTLTTMKDWRPITLCNILYKLISKVNADRLKVVLPKCVFDTQSVFVPSRSILDNALIVIEVINYMKMKMSGTLLEQNVFNIIS